MNTKPNPQTQPPGLLDDRIYVPDHKRYVVVKQSEILYVKAARSSVELFLVDGSRRVVSTYLGRFNTYLDDALFLQVSRSYIVNLLYVTSIRPRSIELNQRCISVTLAYRDQLMQRIKLVQLRPETR